MITNIHQLINGGFTIYPNPNSGIFNVEINDSNNNNFTIEVSDMMGTRVYFIEHLQAGIIQIDITNSAKGIYFVKILAGGQTFTKKVVYR
ncbi:MAG: T9SS type A sorting domain-containing protein [Bacteroidales bacterium]